MIDSNNVPPVSDTELLARFIFSSNEFRPADNSVTPRLFMPAKELVVSVNRHRDATIEEAWEIGQDVAKQRNKTLYGRSDIPAHACKLDSLSVVAKPFLRENPNHAEIVGYPEKKEDQKSVAQKLAAAASHRIIPPQQVSDETVIPDNV